MHQPRLSGLCRSDGGLLDDLENFLNQGLVHGTPDGGVKGWRLHQAELSALTAMDLDA